MRMSVHAQIQYLHTHNVHMDMYGGRGLDMVHQRAAADDLAARVPIITSFPIDFLTLPSVDLNIQSL